MKKALTTANIQAQKVKRIPFDGPFYQAFGRPQDKGVWFVWGNSGSGKSTFLMQLSKVLGKQYKVLYNLLEEEPSDLDYIERTKSLGMAEVGSNFLTASYSPDELREYLGKRGSAHVVVIDSILYFTRSFSEYQEIKKEFKNKIFIISGHASGSQPKTKLEDDIMFDARMKIYISGYLAACKGRTIGPNGGNYVIWEEGYEKVNGEIKKQA